MHHRTLISTVPCRNSTKLPPRRRGATTVKWAESPFVLRRFAQQSVELDEVRKGFSIEFQNLIAGPQPGLLSRTAWLHSGDRQSAQTPLQLSAEPQGVSRFRT